MMRDLVVLAVPLMWVSALLLGSQTVFLGFLTLVCAGVVWEMAALLIAAACGVGGQFGDDFESLLKRGAGVRDSSRIFTGDQRGVLDAMDGFLCTVPLVEMVLALTTA